MLINYDISDKILVISEDITSGKGGVVTVVKTLSKYYEQFNYIPSTNQKGKLSKLYTFSKCIILLLYNLTIKRIKIVHIHGASYGSFLRKSILILICNIFRVKIVYHIHSGAFKDFYNKHNYLGIIDKTLNSVDVLIVLSENWHKYYAAIATKPEILVLNNILLPPKEIVKHKIKYPLQAVFMGVITEAKGIFDLLSVFAKNKEIFEKKIVLTIGGVGNIEKLEKIIQEGDLKDMVVYEGWVTDKEHLFNKSDIFILPSYYEGLPMSILEAMSYGLPVISTNVGGIGEIVHNNENGVLITPGNKTQLKEAIIEIIDNPSLISSMGTKSQEIVKSFYPETVIPILDEIYKQLLGDNKK